MSKKDTFKQETSLIRPNIVEFLGAESKSCEFSLKGKIQWLFNWLVKAKDDWRTTISP